MGHSPTKLIGMRGAAALCSDGRVGRYFAFSGPTPYGVEPKARAQMAKVYALALDAAPHLSVSHYHLAGKATPNFNRRGAFSERRLDHIASTKHWLRHHHVVGFETKGHLTAQPLVSNFDHVKAAVNGRAQARHYSFLAAAFEKLSSQAQRETDQFLSQISTVSSSQPMDSNAVYRFVASLANADLSLLDESAAPPAVDWRHTILTNRVEIDPADGCITWRSPVPRYGLVLTAKRFRSEYQTHIWDDIFENLDLHLGAIKHHWTPFSLLAREGFFSGLQRALSREGTSPLSLLFQKSNDATATVDRIGEHLRDEYNEVLKEERTGNLWGHLSISLMLVDPDRSALQETAEEIISRLRSRDVDTVMETRGAVRGFSSFFPGGDVAVRRIPASALAAAVTTPLFGEDSGNSDEPPIIVLRTRKNSAYQFHPRIGQMSSCIGIGIPRSGKTMFNNVSIPHYIEAGGRCALIAYDDGSDGLALTLDDKASQFLLPGTGLNPFCSSTPDLAHTSQLMQMLANDGESVKLDPNEIGAIDQACKAVFALDFEHRCFHTFLAHLPRSIQRLFAAWNDGGVLKDVFGSRDDQVLATASPFTLLNFRAVVGEKDRRRAPVLSEILHRLGAQFADPAIRTQQKTLIVDEAHFALSDETLAKQLVQYVRTLPKWNGAVHLWSHSPEDFSQVPDWKVLRDGCSTWVFMCDPAADERYTDAFAQLNTADLDVIRTIKPQSEMYIVQPGRGGRQVVSLDIDPWTLAWAGSHAELVARRRALLQEHPTSTALDMLASETMDGVSHGA